MTNIISSLTIRPARPEDGCDIDRLAHLSVSTLLRGFLTEAQMAETDDFNERDPWLIDDGTYFVALIDGTIIGSGGWSRRQAHIRGPDASADGAQFIDPANGAARIRAMYTHPDYARSGIGRSILSVSETGARLAGYRHAELVASLVGEKLYRSCGWAVAEWGEITTRSGLAIPVAHMTKTLRKGAAAVSPVA